MNRNHQRGGGRTKALIWLFILGALVYLGVKTVPAYVNNYQLEDTMKTEVRFASVNRRTPEELRDVIYRKIQELDIPARREDIRIEPISNGFRVTVTYDVIVELPGYKHVIHFKPSADPLSS